MNIKTVLVTAVSTVLIASAGIAGAQDITPPVENDARTGFLEQRGERFDARVLGGEFQALVEEFTGLQGRDVMTALRDGETLASLIEANGNNVEAFIDEAVAQAEARFDEAVANEQISEERANQLKENLREGIETRVNGEYPLIERRGDRDGLLRDSEMVTLIEQYTGLTAQQVAQSVRDDATIAELIEANGGDVDAFVTEATALAHTRIDERAEEMKANAEEAITAFINGERPLRRGNNN